MQDESAKQLPNVGDRDLGGRPTKYRPEYCEMLIEHRKNGFSFETFAAIVHVDRDTIYHWTKLFPAFSDAKKISDTYCRLWWESVGNRGVTGKIEGFSSSTWVFNMKARWGWRDGSETGHQTDTKREYKIEWADDADNTEAGPQDSSPKEDQPE